MAYIRYKAVTKDFNFTKVLKIKEIPSYGKDYIYDDETILAVYKVGKDHSIITDKKIILFDNSTSFGTRKEITTVPFTSITAHSVIFHSSSTEIYLLLQTGNPLILKFSNMADEDKLRVRLLYNAISCAICKQTIPTEIIKKLTSDNLELKNNEEYKK